MLTSFVPKGGAMHIGFWINMGLFYYTNKSIASVNPSTITPIEEWILALINLIYYIFNYELNRGHNREDCEIHILFKV